MIRTILHLASIALVTAQNIGDWYSHTMMRYEEQTNKAPYGKFSKALEVWVDHIPNWTVYDVTTDDGYIITVFKLIHFGPT